MRCARARSDVWRGRGGAWAGARAPGRALPGARQPRLLPRRLRGGPCAADFCVKHVCGVHCGQMQARPQPPLALAWARCTSLRQARASVGTLGKGFGKGRWVGGPEISPRCCFGLLRSVVCTHTQPRPRRAHTVRRGGGGVCRLSLGVPVGPTGASDGCDARRCNCISGGGSGGPTLVWAPVSK